jgi:hypothetical protein
VFGLLLPEHRDMRGQMRHNLEVLGDQVAGTPASATGG